MKTGSRSRIGGQSRAIRRMVVTAMLGAITGRPVNERVSAGIAAHLIAAQKGARILRVHDVAATRDALSVWQAVEAIRA